MDYSVLCIQKAEDGDMSFK